MVRSYKYRLYPNKQQRIALSQTLAIHRLLYNQALEQRISLYKNEHKSITYNEQWKHFRDIRRENDNILGLINASILYGNWTKRLDVFSNILKLAKKRDFQDSNRRTGLNLLSIRMAMEQNLLTPAVDKYSCVYRTLEL